MKFGIKSIFAVICFSCIATVFSGCNLLKSPISMVKKFGIWQLADDDRWRDDYYSNPTWERIMKEYRYFADYKSSNWSKQKLGDQWYLYNVTYTTKLHKNLNDEDMGALFISNKKVIPIDEVLKFYKKGIRLSESRTLAGMSVIYPTQDKERILEIIMALESGNITDISFSNTSTFLRWIINKLANADYNDNITFLGTYVIADVKLKNSDGTERIYERLVFYTTPDDPLDPYRYDEPFSFH
jgi:hypothetical protein